MLIHESVETSIDLSMIRFILIIFLKEMEIYLYQTFSLSFLVSA